MPNDKEKETDTKVVSLFFMGTGLSDKTHSDIIVTYHDAAREQSDNVSTMLFNGPGSTEHNGDIVGLNLDKKLNTVIDNSALNSAAKSLGSGISKMTGIGVEDNVKAAIEYYKKSIHNIQSHGSEQQTLPVLNLHGFSRGADTAVRVANALASLYPEIKINLFLIDQVPGPGNRQQADSFIIPPNVKHMVSNLMLHENTPGFHPQDKSRIFICSPKETDVRFLTFPGWHGCATKITPDTNTNHVAQIVHDNLFNFACQTGTLNEDSEVPPIYKRLGTGKEKYIPIEAGRLSDDDRLKLYEDMLSHEEHYKSQLKTKYPLRKVHRQHAAYLTSKAETQFINQEHIDLVIKLCRENYPHYYQAEMTKVKGIRCLDISFNDMNLQVKMNKDVEDMKENHPGLLGKLQHIVISSSQQEKNETEMQVSRDLEDAISVLEDIVNFHQCHNKTKGSQDFILDATHTVRKKASQVLDTVVPTVNINNLLDAIVLDIQTGIDSALKARTAEDKKTALADLEERIKHVNTQIIKNEKLLGGTLLASQLIRLNAFTVETYNESILTTFQILLQDIEQNLCPTFKQQTLNKQTNKTQAKKSILSMFKPAPDSKKLADAIEAVQMQYQISLQKVHNPDEVLPTLMKIDRCNAELLEAIKSSGLYNKLSRDHKIRLKLITNPTSSRIMQRFAKQLESYIKTHSAKTNTVHVDFANTMLDIIDKNPSYEKILQQLLQEVSPEVVKGPLGDLCNMMKILVTEELKFFQPTSPDSNDSPTNERSIAMSIHNAIAVIFTMVTQSIAGISDLIVGIGSSAL